jgi:hypothetical protein
MRSSWSLRDDSMTRSLRLPAADGSLLDWRPSGKPPIEPQPGGFVSRAAYAAAHVVADPLADPADPSPAIDWEATLQFRRYLWSLGLGVAEAMDTAQRGMGLDWAAAKQLISASVGEAKDTGALLVCGAGTDQLLPEPSVGLEDVLEAYQEQVAFVEGMGGRVMLMASRALAACAASTDDYLEVYGRVVGEASSPVMIHWLGEMFDPALAGYWGSEDPWKALETVLELIRQHPGRIDGVKISLLDDDLEVALRRGLPSGVRVYTGDDFNYVELILGDEEGHSDALLGAFDAIAPAAAAALQALDSGEVDRYRSILEPTLPLARHIFSAPTFNYKTGVVFLAYLNGHQTHFRMVRGAENSRSVPHLARVLVLADEAALLRDPDLAVHRMRLVLELAGVT